MKTQSWTIVFLFLILASFATQGPTQVAKGDLNSPEDFRKSGGFEGVSRIDDSRLEEIFAREVLTMLVHKELLSPEWADRLLSWRHTGFHVHSRVRAKTKTEAEQVGKYMIRPLLSLERLSLDEREGRVAYRYGKETREAEAMDYLEFIARVTSHIPDKGQVTVRYYGLYANAQFSSTTSS